MPITFSCPCGRTLRVKDELVGKQVRCPICNEITTAPAAEAAIVVEEPPPPAAFQYELDEDEQPAKKPAPKWKRGEGDDKKKPAWKGEKGEKKDTKPEHFGIEKKVLRGGVLGGCLAMLIAIVWFVVGLMNDTIFFYPPILFIIGLVAFIKALVGGDEEDEEDEDKKK